MGVIKKVVMTASLGLVMFFSGPASADIMIVAVCVVDSNSDRLIFDFVDTTDVANTPTEVERGKPCLPGLLAIRNANCSRFAWGDTGNAPTTILTMDRLVSLRGSLDFGLTVSVICS